MHIASGDLWAGAEVQLYTLARALAAIPQVEVSVILLNHGTLEDRLAGAGIHVEVIDESQHNGIRILREITRALRRIHPDIVHTHRTKENILGSIGALLAGRIPSLRTVHGNSEHELRWWQLSGRLIRFLDHFTGRRLQRRIISVSDELAGVLGKHYPATMIRTIENGIDIPAPGPTASTGDTASGESHTTLRIGFAGRLVPVKRIDLILETARLVRQQAPALNIVFSIFGDGPLRQTLEQQCRDAGVDDIVTFHGHCENIHDELRKQDVLLMTSDHEGLPMVLLEAMTLRTVVVAHAVGGIPALLDHGKCGVPVEKHTPGAYAGAILALARDNARRERLADAALQRIHDRYSAASNAQATLQEYRALYG